MIHCKYCGQQKKLLDIYAICDGCYTQYFVPVEKKYELNKPENKLQWKTMLALKSIERGFELCGK